MSALTDRVRGFCPCGCGETLFLGSGGYITCSWVECPYPDAANDLLCTPFYGRLFFEQIKREGLTTPLARAVPSPSGKEHGE